MTDIVTLDCKDQGSGEPAFVLIHGLGCDHSDWIPQIEHLSRSNRVIAPTLRGHGGEASSPLTLTMENLAADVVALMRSKAVSKAVIAGHSLGTRVAHEVAYKSPELVAGLILVDGSHGDAPDLNKAIAFFEQATSGDNLKIWLKAFFEDMFFDQSFDILRNKCVERAMSMPDDSIRSLYKNLITWDSNKGEDRMTLVDAPTLVLQSTKRAEDGSRLSLQAGEYGPYPETVKRCNARAEVATLAGHGHFISLEAPSWTNQLIEEWSKRHAFL